MDHELTLTLSLQAPGEARRSLATRYAGSMEPSLLDDVVLAASEIVTNAVVHSGCPVSDPISLTAAVNDDVLRVAITDNGEGIPSLQPRFTVPPSGLALVDAVTDRWSSQVGHSFQVWFEIDVSETKMLSRRK